MSQLLWMAGVDEAGRGPLAGEVVASAVILDPSKTIIDLNDSKKLTAKKRDILYDKIIESAISYAIASSSVAEIDEMNILQASLLAMRRAVLALDVKPVKVCIDGNQIPKEMPMPCEAIVKGDQKVQAIMAASILAKVTRDRMCDEYDLQYPQYGFAKHKGYPTAMHRQALREFGVLDIHRRSYKPVRDILSEVEIE